MVHEDLLYHLNNSSYQWQLIIHNNLIIVITYNSFKYLLKAIQSLIKNVNEDYDGLASIHLRILLIESFIKSHGTIKSLENEDFHDEVFKIQAIWEVSKLVREEAEALAVKEFTHFVQK